MAPKTVTFNYIGDEVLAKRLKPFGENQLSILLDSMKFRGLNQYRRVTLINDLNTIIECKSVFGTNTVNIYALTEERYEAITAEIPVKDEDITVKKEANPVLCWILWAEIPQNYAVWETEYEVGSMMPAEKQDDLFRVYLMLNKNGTTTWYTKAEIEALGYDTKDPWNLRLACPISCYGSPPNFSYVRFELFKNRGVFLRDEESSHIYSRQYLLSLPDGIKLSIVVDEISTVVWTRKSSGVFYYNFSLAPMTENSIYVGGSPGYTVSGHWELMAHIVILFYWPNGDPFYWTIYGPEQVWVPGFEVPAVPPTELKQYFWYPTNTCEANMRSSDDLVRSGGDNPSDAQVDSSTPLRNIGKASSIYVQDIEVQRLSRTRFFVQLRLKCQEHRTAISSDDPRVSVDPSDDLMNAVLSFLVSNGVISEMELKSGTDLENRGSVYYSTETRGTTPGINNYIGTRILKRVNVDSIMGEVISTVLKSDVAWEEIKVPTDILGLITVKQTELPVEPLVFDDGGEGYISGYDRTVNGPYLILPRR